MEQYADSLIIVTGGTSGIGRSILQSLLNQLPNQSKIISLSRRETDFQDQNVVHIPCDVSNPASIDQAFKKIAADFPDKKVSVVVNSAGMFRAVPLLSDPKLTELCEADTSFENAAGAFQKAMDLNVLGLALVVRRSVELMDHQKPGYIINVASIASHRVSKGNSLHFYSATKYALKALTEGLRHELHQLGSQIKVGQISPGFVDTELFDNSGAMDNEEYKKKVTKVLPDALRPDDCSKFVLLMLEGGPNCQVHDVLMRPRTQID